jgi:hypothetical protein
VDGLPILQVDDEHRRHKADEVKGEVEYNVTKIPPAVHQDRNAFIDRNTQAFFDEIGLDLRDKDLLADWMFNGRAGILRQLIAGGRTPAVPGYRSDSGANGGKISLRARKTTKTPSVRGRIGLRTMPFDTLNVLDPTLPLLTWATDPPLKQ